jgi:sortase A
MRIRLLIYFGCALILGGALALYWYAYLQLDAFRAQRSASRSIDARKTRNQPSFHAQSIPRALVLVPPRPGEPVGRIEIPRLHLSVMILEGATPKILRVGAGHINGTALPGSTGNVGIAAHRDTFFRPLRNVRTRDTILVTTSYGTFPYVVDAVEIVNPSDVRVLYPTSDAELTFVTCYPFTYFGAAPKRFIVHAHQQG